MEDRPIRIKLARRLSSTGSATWYLSAKLGTQSITSSARVITQEGQILAAGHSIVLLNFL